MKTNIKGLKFNVSVNCEIGSYKETPSNNSSYSEIELGGFNFGGALGVELEEEQTDMALKDVIDTGFKALGEGLVDKLRAEAESVRERAHARTVKEEKLLHQEMHEHEMDMMKARKDK